MDNFIWHASQMLVRCLWYAYQIYFEVSGKILSSVCVNFIIIVPECTQVYMHLICNKYDDL